MKHVGLDVVQSDVDLLLHAIAPAGAVEAADPAEGLLSAVVDESAVVGFDDPIFTIRMLFEDRLEVHGVGHVTAVAYPAFVTERGLYFGVVLTFRLINLGVATIKLADEQRDAKFGETVNVRG